MPAVFRLVHDFETLDVRKQLYHAHGNYTSWKCRYITLDFITDFLRSKEILTCIHRYFLHSCQSTERGLLNEFKKVWTTDQHRKRMVMIFRLKTWTTFMFQYNLFNAEAGYGNQSRDMRVWDLVSWRGIIRLESRFVHFHWRWHLRWQVLPRQRYQGIYYEGHYFNI